MNRQTVAADGLGDRGSEELVREQLERLLADHRLAASPRCALLLRYVVEEAMQGRAETLKERNIGIDVFKRPAHYDTSSDPVVRAAASELRKKLAQYYCEPENRGQLRIEVPVGSYAPRFLTLKPSAEAIDTAPEAAAILPVALRLQRSFSRRLIAAVAGIALLLAASAGCLLAWRATSRRSPLDSFWAPVLKSGTPVSLCLGQMIAAVLTPVPDHLHTAGGSPALFDRSASRLEERPVAIPNDSITLANIAGLLRTQHRSFSARIESSTSYADLLRSPTVLIGGLDNDWTIYLMRNLRFRFVQDPVTGDFWISDQLHPAERLGLKSVTGSAPATDDLAIAARILSPETGQPTVIVAGLTSKGTLAAGNFLTSEDYFQEFAKSVPPDWAQKNLEILLRTTIVDGQPGPAHVVAYAIW